MPRVSIVIPSYLRSDKLRECLKSIAEFTSPEDVEVAVVANGAAEETKSIFNEFAAKWKGHSALLWFDDPIGYSKACNAGIRESESEFVILLNDDVQLLTQSTNEWVDVLLKPMLEDGAVGITGPLEEYDPNSKRRFIIFFCVMIRRALFDEIGLLDEAFTPYFGEDCALCIEATRKGWKVIRVPEDSPTELKPIDPNTTTLETWKHDKIHTGNYPAFHDAESTIGRLPESEDVLRRNRELLRMRYADLPDISRALRIDGWMAPAELEWLGHNVKGKKVVIECGSWKGRSTRVLADHLDSDAVLYAVDSFAGSSGEPDFHAEAKERQGDEVYMAFLSNLKEYIVTGQVVPLRMRSANAASLLKDWGISADMVFIDADHSYEGCKADIENFRPLLKEGGLLCGHDYNPEQPYWVGVRDAVQELIPAIEEPPNTSIWVASEGRGKVYDCFLYSNEEDVMEIRLNTLNDVVDFFVLVEGTQYHNGDPKPLVFNENKERFAPFLHKIIHIVVDDWPEAGGSIYDNAWMRERWQRDAILHGLRECKPNDIIILGDADEIANPEAIKNYNVSQGLCRLKQRMFYYYLNCENKDGWDWQKIAPYKLVKELTPCGIRYPPAGDTPLIENGGWHFSFCSDVDGIIKKIQTYSHREFDTPEITNRERVEQLVSEGKDIFGRELKYEFVGIDDGCYPQYVQDNLTEMIRKGLWRVRSPHEPVRHDPDPFHFTVPDRQLAQQPLTITAEISTKDRYTTTFPLTISSILNQTHKPDKLVIYDDGEQKDLRELSPFKGLLAMADDLGIKWEIFATPRKGQVANHQHCLDTCTTDLIFRCDDDCIVAPDCLERLLAEMKDDVGAVAGLIHHPGNVSSLPDFIDGSLTDIQRGLNIQWFDFNSGPREVQHLYSSFLVRVSALRAVGGYPKTLSIIGHHEESIASHLLHRAGWKLIVTPYAKTQHLRESSGGIRSFTDQSLWEHDEQVWQSYLSEWGANNGKPTKLICADMGLGDHLILKAVLPEIRKRHTDKEICIAACFPEVFEDVSDVRIISIADAKLIIRDRYDDYSLYRWCWVNNWNKPMADAMITFWGQ